MTTCTARAPTVPGTTPTATTARQSTTTGRSGTQRAASPSPGHTLLSHVTSSVTLNTVTGRTSPCSRCAGPWCRWAACPRSRVSEDVRSPSSHVVVVSILPSTPHTRGAEYLSSVERLWSVWGAWLEADYLALAQPLAHAGSAALSNIGKCSSNIDRLILSHVSYFCM